MNDCILYVYKSIKAEELHSRKKKKKHIEVFKHVQKGVVRSNQVLLLHLMFRVSESHT